MSYLIGKLRISLSRMTSTGRIKRTIKHARHDLGE
ncbi:hypothetical protein MSMEI_3902 [Mycolicibacterium smegmatis MC2 155]|uniref:Uncharacterized protein n=1 Tax=Mycolicibacterium smegmatis (strain ATCC 700084 / mc(2)155) TaxID=246196 RepID=I7FG41_MYCS2|nr:hypothetical protein MSMEI_3902 [Mycolicibacterium smegmatis MC2 155]